MISASFLSIKENVKDNIEKLDTTTIDMLHVDIMDGLFVENKTWSIEEIVYLLKDTIKPKDVHLMVNDVKKYIDDFKSLKPEYITFHYEATSNVLEMIKYIKSLGIKVGLSIKPNTSVDSIKEYLEDIDLVLVMSVEPGRGGQKFMEDCSDKLKVIKEHANKDLFLQVDGGINDVTAKICTQKGANSLVAGNYIYNSDNIKKAIESLR